MSLLLLFRAAAADAVVPIPPNSDTPDPLVTLPFGGSVPRGSSSHHYADGGRTYAAPDHEEQDEEEIIAMMMLHIAELELA